MKDKFLLRSIILIILLTTAGTIHAQIDDKGTKSLPVIPGGGSKTTSTTITGSGTTNTIPLFNSATTITSSIMYQNNSNIGIGTTTPISKLHINSGTQKMSFDKLDGTNLGYGRSYIGFNASRSTDNVTNPWIVNGDGSNNGASVIWSNCVGNLYFATIPTNGTNTTVNYSDDDILSYLKMIIQSNGTVGIGTISPSQKLQVDGGNILVRGTNNFQNNGNEAILKLGDDNNYIKSICGGGLRIGAYCSGSSQDVISINPSGNMGIGITDNLHAKLDINAGTSTGLYVKTQQTANNGYCILASVNRDNTKALAISKDGTENFVVYGNGAMGVGTGNLGSYKLAVAGKIHCTEVVVEATPWPDYVFDKGYKLMPVKELEQYVTANKHLPGIPDAQTVSEKGVSVGEMNAQLLKKVEELTMYVIQLNKEIEQLKAQNAKR